jgi:hypothetical protein
MRLSDKSFNNFVRLGGIIIVIACLIFGFNPRIGIALSLVGSIILFFPMFTKQATTPDNDYEEWEDEE